jgi:hypothetical protein
MLVNVLALELGRSPQGGALRRAWTSAVAAVFLTWTGYGILRGHLSLRMLNDGWAALLTVASCTIGSSTIGLVVGWALPPGRSAGGSEAPDQ